MAETLMKKRGILCRDEMGDILIDSNGYVKCVIEDGRLFEIKYDEINFSSNILNFVVDNVQVHVDLSKEATGQINKTHALENEDCNQNKTTTDIWDDASTKLFLNIYKCKKDLVSARKIKTYKLLWNNIAEDMTRNGYLVSPLQVENKFKSLTRSYKNMISNNKKTGRGRATCKFEAELTDLFAKKHNIIPVALSGRNGLVLREEQNSEKENNTSLNNSANDNNESENDPDEPSSVAGTSANASNTSVKNKNLQKMKSRTIRRTENFKECLGAIQSLTSEMKSERQIFQNMQVEILEEYKNLKKIQEDFTKSATEQWATANAQREERNRILKEIAQNYCDKEIYL